MVSNQHSLRKFYETEVLVVSQASNLMSQIIFPSEIIQYILISIGMFNNDSIVLQFVSNLCRHEIWENGNGTSYFVMAYCAIFIFFEQMGDLPKIIQLLKLLNRLENENVALTPEVALVRQKLIRNAVRLTNSEELILRLKTMLKHDFFAIVQHVNELQVMPIIQNAGQARQNLEPVELP